MFKNFTFRDALIVAAIIGQAYVVNYRVGSLEKQFVEFRKEYVTQASFDLTIENLKLQMNNNDLTLKLALTQHKERTMSARKEDPAPTAQPAQQGYPYYKKDN